MIFISESAMQRADCTEEGRMQIILDMPRAEGVLGLCSLLNPLELSRGYMNNQQPVQGHRIENPSPSMYNMVILTVRETHQ